VALFENVYVAATRDNTTNSPIWVSNDLGDSFAEPPGILDGGVWVGLDMCRDSSFHYVLAVMNRRIDGSPGEIYSYVYGPGILTPVSLNTIGKGNTPPASVREAYWSGIAISYDCSKSIAIQYKNATGHPGSVYRMVSDILPTANGWEKATSAGTGHWVAIASSKRYYTRPSGPWSGKSKTCTIATITTAAMTTIVT